MTGIFRTNQLLINILFFPVAIIFMINHWKIETAVVLGGLVFQSFYVNYLFQRQKLNPDSHQFSGLFSFLLGILLLFTEPSWEIILVNSILIIALGTILTVDKQSVIAGKLLNIGLLIGISILLLPSVWLIIFVMFFGLNRLRAYKFIERIQLIVGVFLVFIYVFLYLFLTDRLKKLTIPDFNPFAIFKIDFNFFESSILIFFFVIMLTVIFSLFLYTRKKNFQIQRKLGIFYIWTIVSSLIWLLTSPIEVKNLYIMSFPLGILLGQNFYQWPKWLGEIVFWVILGAGLFLYFKNLI